jgi:enoyl-CoA hydratase
MSARLPRAVGLRKAKELSLTGNFIDAEEALRLGLVNHVVPHEELLPRTRQLAADIAAADPVAVTRLLALYKRGDGATLEEAIAYEDEVIAGWVVDRGAMASRRAAMKLQGGNAAGADEGGGK